MLARFHHAFRDFSIQRKLTLIITLTSALSLLLACAGFVLNDVLTFREVTRDNTATLASVVGNNTVAALNFDDADAAREALGTLSGEPHVIAAALYKSGMPFAEYQRGADPEPLPERAPPAGLENFAAGRLELARHVVAGGETFGTLYIVTDLGALDERLRNYFAIAGGLLFAATLAAFGLSSAFQRVVSRPLSQLVQLARRVSEAKDYTVRAPMHSRGEIGQLFDGFNEMLAQIQQRDAALLAAHDDLERRVLERTRQLEEQVAERGAAERALQQQLTRISLLNQIATALSDRQDLDRIVQTVLAELERHLPVDFGSVSIFDPGTKQLEVAASRCRAMLEVRGGVQPLAPRGAFTVALDGLDECRQGEQMYIPDTSGMTQPLARRFAQAGLRSVVLVPLLVERRFFGLLVVARAEAGAFTSGESEFLRMLGEQVGVAGSQARLYSELQRAYTDLRQSQRTVMQQERLRALGQMASGIAHDINNSLTPIVTFADILLTQRTELPEKVRTYLTHIQTAGVDIGMIVSRLREFYRPRDSDEPHLPVDLHAMLRQVGELTRPRWRDMPQARGTVIDLQTDFAPEIELVGGNESELRESLINLVLNAVDAMPRGGTLTFRTRRKPATGSDSRDEVAVEISDTGVGMNEETRSRCLEPFFSTKGHLGTGLGLAMVYGVLERHGGRIEIDSARNVGTTMRLIFPPWRGAAEAAALGLRDEQPRRLRILCVDDDPMLRHVLDELFRLDGHQVVLAESGAAGLVAFREAAETGTPFDIVVSDLGMPHMDGQQFAEAIKQQAADTPIVLLTGWGKIMKQDGDLPPGIDAVLSKPPRLSELRSTFTRLLAAGRSLPPWPERRPAAS